MSPNAVRTVLIVEPDADARSALRNTFEREGYTVVATGGAADALAVLETPEIGLVVTELYLDNGPDACLVQSIRASSPPRSARVLAYTRHGRVEDRAWAKAKGADGYVLKKNGEARLLEVAGRLSRRTPRAAAARRKRSV